MKRRGNNMKLQELAAKINENLTTIKLKNDEDTRIIWKDEAPEELKRWFRDVTADSTGYSFAELDECYEVLEDLCYIINENDTEDEDTLTEAIYDHEWSTVYNYDLLQWVQDNLYRLGDVNDALSEGATTIEQAIAMAMESTRQSYAMQFLTKMQEYGKVEA
jgi:hypothetical protein